MDKIICSLCNKDILDGYKAISADPIENGWVYVFAHSSCLDEQIDKVQNELRQRLRLE